MSAPKVDVLTVMDHALNCVDAYELTQKGKHAADAREHRAELIEARAAVAEMIKAARKARANSTGHAFEILDAALARIGSGA